MTRGKGRTPKPETCSIDKDMPSCDTGPFGRLSWTVKELWSLFHKTENENPHEN